MDYLAHAHPSAAFFNLDLVVPVMLVAFAALCRRTRDAGLLLVAAAAMFASAMPPLHDAAARSVTGHMVQHLVIIMIAAPCIGVVLAMAPTKLRRNPIGGLAAAVTSPLAPVVAGTIHASALVIWHVPGPYDAAVSSWFVHGLEHITLLGSAAWWWASVVHHAARTAVASAVVSLFGVATAGAALGVFMMFAPVALYAQGGVADQQIAGALMAGGTGGIYAATALWLASRAVSRLATPRPQRISVGSRGAATVVTIAGCVLVTTVAMVATNGATSPASGAVATQPELTQPELTPPETDADTDTLGAGRDRGRELYRRDCASCHGPSGQGSFRGTSLDGVGTASVRYMLDTGRMPIAAPDDTIARSEPAYSPDEIDDIVTYVATMIDGPDALAPDTSTANLAAGGVHYRLQCAACHGAEGIGGALAFEGFAPSLQHSTADDVANAMVAGPGVMPTFAATFDESDIADIAAYVMMLQDPPRTGIAVPGGRVGEGLVAWLAGIGALLMAARWMGARQ